MKWQCPELDKIMNEKRAAAAAAGGKGKGKAAMELGNEWFLQAPAAGVGEFLGPPLASMRRSF